MSLCLFQDVEAVAILRMLLGGHPSKKKPKCKQDMEGYKLTILFMITKIVGDLFDQISCSYIMMIPLGAA